MEYGRQPLDFSMNVNPLGISPAAAAAIAEAAARADRYPDPLCRTLTQRLAEAEGIPQDRIFCGNGAADIIFRLAQALKPEPPKAPVLLVTAPTFSEYETAFAENGWQIRRYMLRESRGFQIGEDILDAIGEDTDAVFLCEPNNPTGITTDHRLLQRICDHCRRAGTDLVIDECFNGFLTDPQAHTMVPQLRTETGSLIIMKAFTKLYGMAGVRLGYCLCGDAEMTERLRRAGPPWNVSSLAQAAGIAALEDTDHVKRGLKITEQQRPWLKARLAELLSRGDSGAQEQPAAGQPVAEQSITGNPATVYGEANYLLFRAWPGLDRQLRRRGILIRNCSNYPGLGEGWYRIAVRTQEENIRLIEAIKEELV
ncbi:MAG: aminotransferase class I/II-fold pyridoxal phosphate-dependent enzyme [Firmicutes bacterium]|nr:aminotransferase class I/II-fold pyridoxal phosphate-dependent enzyme [Bacillota bacterium]